MIYLYVYLAGVFVTFCFNLAYTMEIEEITPMENIFGSIFWPALWLIYLFAELIAINKRS